MSHRRAYFAGFILACAGFVLVMYPAEILQVAAAVVKPAVIHSVEFLRSLKTITIFAGASVMAFACMAAALYAGWRLDAPAA